MCRQAPEVLGGPIGYMGLRGPQTPARAIPREKMGTPHSEQQSPSLSEGRSDSCVFSTPNPPAEMIGAAFPHSGALTRLLHKVMKRVLLLPMELVRAPYSVPLLEVHSVNLSAWSSRGAYLTLPNKMFAYLS